MSGKGHLPQVSALIAAYRPHAVSEAAADFARHAVGAAAPSSPARAQALLFATGRLAAFGQEVGLELCTETLLSEASIECFILRGTAGLSPASVRTIRTNLRALSRALDAHREPLPTRLARERAKPPYTPAQIEGYLRLAEAQSTQALRMRALALICLGAGSGIVAGELRHVRGEHVMQRCGGVIVRVAGQRARVVPVLAHFHEPLLDAAAFAGEHLITGGRDPGRRNITDALCRTLSADSSLPRLQAGRLRSSWLCACAQEIGLGAFMAAAGVVCSQRLGDIAASLPAVDEAQMVALLGGHRGH
jgi:integrase